MNGIYVLFEKPKYFPQFVAYMNKQHLDARFLTVVEYRWVLFLDTNVLMGKSKFDTSVYGKDFFRCA